MPKICNKTVTLVNLYSNILHDLCVIRNISVEYLGVFKTFLNDAISGDAIVDHFGLTAHRLFVPIFLPYTEVDGGWENAKHL